MRKVFVLMFCLLFLVASSCFAFTGADAIVVLSDADTWKNIAAIIGVASFVANKTKTDQDDKAIGFVSKLVNMIALNFFRVKF